MTMGIAISIAMCDEKAMGRVSGIGRKWKRYDQKGDHHRKVSMLFRFCQRLKVCAELWTGCLLI